MDAGLPISRASETAAIIFENITSGLKKILKIEKIY
jgi:hypothetical protein